MASLIAAVCAIVGVKLLEKLPMFRLPPVTAAEAKAKAGEVKTEKAAAATVITVKPLAWWGVILLIAYFIFFAGLAVAWLAGSASVPAAPYDDKDGEMVRVLKTLSALSIPLLLSFFPLYAAVRGIKVYEEFVEGAKEGFQVIIRIIPNLVAILVAIGMFRGAGGIDLLTDKLTPLMKLAHFPPELLPMGLIRPLSGSGTTGVFTDVVLKYGPDNILSRMAATMQGSSETTFYVLAVYFGAVGIKRTRYAVPAGLIADLVSLIASVFICKLVFG
jgi:spore maturation protein B